MEKSRFYAMVSVSISNNGFKVLNSVKFRQLIKNVKVEVLKNGLEKLYFIDDENKVIAESVYGIYTNIEKSTDKDLSNFYFDLCRDFEKNAKIEAELPTKTESSFETTKENIEKLCGKDAVENLLKLDFEKDEDDYIDISNVRFRKIHFENWFVEEKKYYDDFIKEEVDVYSALYTGEFIYK